MRLNSNRVWILFLFFSPILASILLQLYIFASTGALVRTEGILTQVIFEHALRIRMKEEAPKTEGTSVPNTPKAHPLGLPPSEDDVEGDTDAASTTATTTMDASASTTAAGSASSNGDDTQPKPSKSTSPSPPAPKAEEKKDDSSSSANLAGRINNLISTDLENITDSRDFMFLIIYAPLQTALCIWFLYKILGWSSFVGMSVIVIGVIAPIEVGKITHAVQVKRMKAVSIFTRQCTVHAKRIPTKHNIILD